VLGTLHFDESRDICIARIGSKTIKKFTPIKVNEKLPRKGETVTALRPTESSARFEKVKRSLPSTTGSGFRLTLLCLLVTVAAH